jgi:hypothetical protein
MTKVIWKDDRKRGKYITNAAVVGIVEIMESCRGDYKPTFTLAPQHEDGLYSLEQLFLEHYTDPTEYSFVEDAFEGDVKHWEEFKNGRFIHPHYLKWKAKAEGRLLSEAMSKIVSTAFDENNKNSFQALKYLVERNNKSSSTTGRGRPKKEKEQPQPDDKLLMDAIKRIQE